MTALDFLASQVEALLKENQRLQDENAALTARLKEAETLASAATALIEVQRQQIDTIVRSVRVQPDPDGGLREGGQ